MRDVLLLGLLLAATPAVAEPVSVATAFCAARVAQDRAATDDLLSAALREIIADAEARSAAIAASGAPPPLAEGVPFQSFAAELDACRPGRVAPAENLTIVDIVFEAGTDRWTDRLVIRRDGGRDVIDDVLFASFPTDTYRAGLRRVLADSFDQ